MYAMKATIAAVAMVGSVTVALFSGLRSEDAAAATLTGCLRQGSGQAVFLLRGATGADDAGARDYLLVSVPADVELAAALNHRVSIVGEVHAASDGPEPPPGANTVERALRRLSVQSMSDIAASCAP